VNYETNEIAESAIMRTVFGRESVGNNCVDLFTQLFAGDIRYAIRLFALLHVVLLTCPRKIISMIVKR